MKMPWLILIAAAGWFLAVLGFALLLHIQGAERRSRVPRSRVIPPRQLALEQAQYRGDLLEEWPTQELPPITD